MVLPLLALGLAALIAAAASDDVNAKVGSALRRLDRKVQPMIDRATGSLFGPKEP